MLLGILHHGLTVSRLDDAVDWYCGVLGFELVHRQRGDNHYTRELVGVPDAVLEVAQIKLPSPLPQISTHDIELIEYVEGSCAGDPPHVNQVAAAHLAFFVTDIEKHHALVVAKGGRFRNPPTLITEGVNKGGWGSYLHDPDGNCLEFIQPAPGRLRAMLATLEAASGTE